MKSETVNLGPPLSLLGKIVFLPVKPEYACRLFDGSKKFEFRKHKFREDVTHIVIYASSPVKKILGLVQIAGIEVNTPHYTWNKTKRAAGISKQGFMAYFSGSQEAVAIEIGKTFKLKYEVDPRDLVEDFSIPQSFKYVDTDFVRLLPF